MELEKLHEHDLATFTSHRTEADLLGNHCHSSEQKDASKDASDRLPLLGKEICARQTPIAQPDGTSTAQPTVLHHGPRPVTEGSELEEVLTMWYLYLQHAIQLHAALPCEDTSWANAERSTGPELKPENIFPSMSPITAPAPESQHPPGTGAAAPAPPTPPTCPTGVAN